LVTEKEDEFFITEGLFVSNEENKYGLRNIQEEQKYIKNDSKGNTIIDQKWMKRKI